jgi:hypothetical protein
MWAVAGVATGGLRMGAKQPKGEWEMGTRTWTRLVAVAIVGVVATVALFGLAAPAPANNRQPLSQLALVAGLSDITAGQPVALSATLENRQNSTYTDVRYEAPIPAGTTFQSTDCVDFQVTATQFICNWGHQLRSRATAKVVYVLTTSGSGAFMTAGAWIIKEGSASSGAPDTFPTNDLAVSVLAADNPSKAGAYATTACADTSAPTVQTFQELSADNPLSTSVCAPNLPQNVLGLPASVNERDGLPAEPGISQVSEICMPAPTFSCAPGYKPFKFSSLATFTFVLRNDSLDGTISKVYHDNVLVPKNNKADPRVISIKVQPFKGITTVVTQSSENGSWRFG